jgi:hypothetical protein
MTPSVRTSLDGAATVEPVGVEPVGAEPVGAEPVVAEPVMVERRARSA